MKITLETPDDLYRQANEQAALQGQSFEEFFVEAVDEKLESASSNPEEHVY